MQLLELQFDPAPKQLYYVHREYAAYGTPQRTPNSNFLRGVKWSPDGACLLTASDDNCLRIYDTPLEAFQLNAEQQGTAADAAAAAAGDGTAAAAPAAAPPEPAGQRVPAQPPAQQAQQDSLHPALRIQEGELIYDYCWYSRMSAADPASCCLAATGRGQPVHLWDACTGELRCTYRAYNDMDEVAPAHSLAFSLEGDALYCGFNRGTIRSFRVERPGRDCTTLAAHKKGKEGLPGIVSCMAFNPDYGGMLAAGSYSGAGALLDSRTRELLCLLEGGHTGGLTHLCFSADGNYLYTGARKDPNILCWDVRYSSGVLYSIQRQTATTNQRMSFDIEPCGRHLATGGEDGVVRLYDLRDGSQAAQFTAAEDTVNGLHFHPFLPLLATASGHRRYFLSPGDNSSDSDDSSDASSASDSDSGASSSSGSEAGGGGKLEGGAVLSPRENVLQVWRCAAQPVAQALPEAEAEDQALEGEAMETAEGQGADGWAAGDAPVDEAAAAAAGEQGNEAGMEAQLIR